MLRIACKMQRKPNMNFDFIHAARAAICLGVSAHSSGCEPSVGDGSVHLGIRQHLKLDRVAMSCNGNKFNLVAARRELGVRGGWRHALKLCVWSCFHLLRVVLSMLLLSTLIASLRLDAMVMSSL
jgi:hypothetical protein